jgi:hypothetical protein
LPPEQHALAHGSAGPEGSVLTCASLLVLTLVIRFAVPKREL